MDVSTLTLKELADLGLISKEMITRIQTRADRQLERLAQNHKLSNYIKRKK
jgi:DNA-directed RNA polymerase sigma subunit (sigma70/sigma32)